MFIAGESCIKGCWEGYVNQDDPYGVGEGLCQSYLWGPVE